MVKSVYVAGGLTVAPDSFKSFLKSLMVVLGFRFQVNKFFSFAVLEDPNLAGRNIHEFDESQVLASDALVAFCDYASTGMGMEIEIARQAGKKIILVYKPNSQPAKILLDFAVRYNTPIVLYSSAEPISDIVARITAKLKK